VNKESWKLETECASVPSNSRGDFKHDDWPEWDHPDDHACTQVLRFVSGMPRHLREGTSLAVVAAYDFQAWFDESGKEGWPAPKTSPIFVVAGYIAPVRVWAKFADEWRAELDRFPKLDFLHAKDSYGFEKEFGMGSAWEAHWGHRNELERDKRLIAFARIIDRHLRPIWSPYGAPDRLRLTWMLKHDEYRDFKATMKNHPAANKHELKYIKNPYYLSFQYVLGSCLKYKNVTRSPEERIQILFDEDMDNKRRLEDAFDEWVRAVRLSDAHLIPQLVNKKAEFRNDRDHPELQAADLLAYHIRKWIMEVAIHGDRDYDKNPLWRMLNSESVESLNLQYHAEQWKQLAGKLFEPFSPLIGTEIIRLGSR
jgi:Protein of unknown function (DUF3800)